MRARVTRLPRRCAFCSRGREPRPSFVSGHAFSHAAKAAKARRTLVPEGDLTTRCAIHLSAKLWVPHPRDVLVLVARVGKHRLPASEKRAVGPAADLSSINYIIKESARRRTRKRDKNVFGKRRKEAYRKKGIVVAAKLGYSIRDCTDRKCRRPVVTVSLDLRIAISICARPGQRNPIRCSAHFIRNPERCISGLDTSTHNGNSGSVG
jgi:hypothetical protein